jgi:8-oxo-dGTP diphosphatase
MTEMQYTYEYPRPIMAADSAIFTVRDGKLSVLLIRRGHEPYENCWAIPGGFVHENEPLDVAAARELEEETGLSNLPLRQMQTFGDPGRDPRGWTVSVVYLAIVDWREHTLAAGDDAREADWFTVGDLPPVAFDHDKVLAFAQRELARAVERDGGAFIPPTFSSSEREALLAALIRAT